MAFGKPIVTLPIGDASDGTSIPPPASKGLTRNDDHFLDKIAERWAKEEGRAQAGAVFRLDRLPDGYGGYEKGREGSKHIDRYLYGHPSGGHFRSINELWPHFKQLQEMGGSVGCECVLCAGKKKKAAGSSHSGSVASSSPARRKSLPVKASSTAPAVKSNLRQGWQDLPQGRMDPVPPPGQRRKQADDEGTPDFYRALLDDLKAKGSGEVMNVDIKDKLSPDWRAGHDMLQELLTEWQDMPGHVPRVGEVVLFARNVTEEKLLWDTDQKVYHRTTVNGQADPPKWEAGVVTQMPLESITARDLVGIPTDKRNVTYSGFRVEPLSEPAAETRPLALSHKYVPLHALRPFCLLKECVGTDDTTWHHSIRHALTLSSSFCAIGRYAFKGMWPEATVFMRGVYLGPELIMVGDVVRIMPADTAMSSISDVMIITSIRLRFVNLDEASDDDFDQETPYNTCLHVAGKAFTLDPKRSFSGTAKAPVNPEEHGLPESLASYGQFYHITDPAQEKARLELPFQRIMGRCPDGIAMKAWLQDPIDISSGLAATRQARSHSYQNDSRIDKAHGKSWFWAETRIEELDLHELNGKFVGAKDESRSKSQMKTWRQALKALDGKRGALEEFDAAKKQREEEQKQESAVAPSSAWGLMAATANVGIATDAEKETGEPSGDAEEDDGDENAMELDESTPSQRGTSTNTGPVIDLVGDDSATGNDDDDGDIMVL